MTPDTWYTTDGAELLTQFSKLIHFAKKEAKWRKIHLQPENISMIMEMIHTGNKRARKLLREANGHAE